MDRFDLRRWRGFGAAGGDVSKPAWIRSVSCDSREALGKEALFVALPGRFSDGHSFVAQAAAKGASFALVRPQRIQHMQGICLLQTPNPLGALQEIARLYRLTQRARVLAITGSYGKTMTKDLIAHLLAERYSVHSSPESFNSQLGVSLSLFGIEQEHDVAIIEAGISKPGEMERLAWMIQPDLALLTCIEEAHLAQMGSLERLLEEKITLLQAVSRKGWVIGPSLVAEREFQAPFARWDQQEIPHVGRAPFPFAGPLIKRSLCAARLLGLSDEEISARLHTYVPEPMRTEIWRSPLGALLVNDCYCGAPFSVEAALRLASYHSEGRQRYFLFNNRLLKITEEAPRGELVKEFSNRKEAFEFLRSESLGNSCLLIKGSSREPLNRLSESFSEGLGDNRLQINLDAIRHNIEALQRHLGSQMHLMAMLKASSYGTDPVMMARFLRCCGVKFFGLAHVNEGVNLRLAGIEEELFVISCAPYEAAQVARWSLQVGVSNETVIEALEAQRQPIRVHLNVNTGMGRLGCPLQRARELAQRIARSRFLSLEGMMTHLASAESPDEDTFTRVQIERFQDVVAELNRDAIPVPLRHIANSSTALRFELQGTNMVRLGLSLYGLHSSSTGREGVALRPALNLSSRICAIQSYKRGESIGYGRTYHVRRDEERIAVVPLGYFDGIHRTYSNRAPVLIRGKRAPICGMICMDYLTVNVSDVPGARVHDDVLFFGEDAEGNSLCAEEFARAGEESVYQLITCLGPRVQRIFVYDAQAREYVLAHL